jgi:hypothetical protein
MERTRLLSSHPPEAPTSIGATVADKQARLAWSDAGAPGAAIYLLVRKQGAVPFTPFDGDILYEGQACSHVDCSAEPLTDYYYRIFTRRGTIYSKTGASFGPVMLIPELENVKILPADQGAQLRWKFNPEIREVLIWRKLGGERPEQPGDGIKLETNRVDGFVDTKIKNDVEYWYFLVAVYSVNGKRVHSKGLCEMITPHKILAPVDRLTIAKSEYGENEFVVNWSNPEIKDLLLLASPKGPIYKIGEVVPVSELLASYRSLSLHARTADSGRFRLSLNGGVWIFVATLFGRFAAVGAPYYLTNLREVENPTADYIDGDLYLNMKWPAGLNEIAVAWKSDGYPDSPDELGVNAVRVTRELYEDDAGVLLRDTPYGTYYFKIFAIYPAPEGEAGVSDGVELLFKNQPRCEVYYRFIYKKKLLNKQAELILSVSGPKVFNMPVALIVAQTGRLPLSKNDGDPLFDLTQETRVNGEVSYHYNVQPLAPDTHLRLFLAEEKLYKQFRLMPGSELKVN